MTCGLEGEARAPDGPQFVPAVIRRINRPIKQSAEHRADTEQPES